MHVKKQQLEPYVEQLTGSKLGKKYVKAVYCHPSCLTSTQITSCEMPGWMKRKLYKKDLNDTDKHDSTITYLEPNILEYEVKCTLGSITTN